MEMKSNLFNCAWMRAHGTLWLFSDMDLFKSRGKIVRIMAWIRRESSQLMSNRWFSFLDLFWVRVGFKFSLF